MRQLHIIVDENISWRVAEFLEENGYQATHIRNTHLKGKDDSNVMAHAKAHSLVLVTLDRDFADVRVFPPRLYAGIIWLKLHNPTTDRINGILISLLAKLEKVSLKGKLIVCDDLHFRIYKEPHL